MLITADYIRTKPIPRLKRGMGFCYRDFHSVHGVLASAACASAFRFS